MNPTYRKRRAMGLCGGCGKQRTGKKSLCSKCAAANKEAARKRLLRRQGQLP